MKRKLILLLKLTVAGSLLYYLLASGKIDLSKLREIKSWGWLVLSQVMIFTMLSTSFLRWHLLLRAQGVKYALRETYTLGFVGFFFNQFVPGSTGGDLVKAYYVAVEQKDLRVPGVLSVFLDRALGLFVLVSICGVASLINFEVIKADAQLLMFAYFIFTLLGGALIAGLIFFNERIRSQPILLKLLKKLPFHGPLNKVQAAIYTYKKHPFTVLVAIGMSMTVHLLLVLSALCYAKAIGPLGISPAVFFFLVPLANLAMSLPVSPGGLGVGELAFVELFAKVGYANGGILAVFHRLNYYSWALVGLVFYLLKRKKVSRAIAMGEAEADATEHAIEDEATHHSIEENQQPAEGDLQSQQLNVIAGNQCTSQSQPPTTC